MPHTGTEILCQWGLMDKHLCNSSVCLYSFTLGGGKSWPYGHPGTWPSTSCVLKSKCKFLIKLWALACPPMTWSQGIKEVNCPLGYVLDTALIMRTMTISIYKVLEKDSTKGIWCKSSARGILPALRTSMEPEYGNCRKQAAQIILWGRFWHWYLLRGNYFKWHLCLLL